MCQYLGENITVVFVVTVENVDKGRRFLLNFQRVCLL